MKSGFLNIAAIAFFTLVSAPGAMAKDQWFSLGQQTIQAANPSVEIKSQGGRWDKDVKQVKIAVEGADVTISKLVLHWDNRPDDTMDNVGTLKSGGETAPYNAPGLKGRLKSTTIYYTIGGGKTSATIKVMGYD